MSLILLKDEAGCSAYAFYPSTWGAQMDLSECKANLIRLSSSRPTKATWWDPVHYSLFFAMKETTWPRQLL